MTEEEKEKLLKESIHKMVKICDEDDTEEGHIHADDLLCDVLEKLGFSELVTVYHQVDKWYA